MMNRRTDNEPLLNDVFGEAASGFREAMLAGTLSLVRRRRHQRQLRNGAGIFLALILLGFVVWQNNPPQKPVAIVPSLPKEKAVEKNYTLVATQPLPAGSVIETASFAAEQFTATSPAIAIVQTTTGNFAVINDDQLLTLVAAHPAILVRTGADSAELIFVKPEDKKAFLVN